MRTRTVTVTVEKDIVSLVYKDRSKNLIVLVDNGTWHLPVDSISRQTVVVPITVKVRGTVEETAQSHPYGSITATEYLTDVYDIVVDIPIEAIFLSEEEVKVVQKKVQASFPWEDILLEEYSNEYK